MSFSLEKVFFCIPLSGHLQQGSLYAVVLEAEHDRLKEE